MTIFDETYKLNNGVEIPKIGFGTWMITDNDDAALAVKTAIQVGYRHIDTAEAYENEVGVGHGVRDSGVRREDIFVTTKLVGEIKDYDDAVAAIDQSLADLGLNYIDMMIIHSPKPWVDFQKEDRFFAGNLAAWRALEEAVDAGKIRTIGVSNFDEVDLQNILDNGRIKPAVDQVLAHIGNVPFGLFDYAKQHDIQIEAYSPFGHGEMLKNPNLQQIADKYGVSVPQLGIRYLLQLDALPLPKTLSEDHMRHNATVDFTISDDDMALLKQVTFNDYGEFSGFPVFGGHVRLRTEMSNMAEKVTAGHDALGAFAPKFAELNDEVLFGQVWSRETELSARDRSFATITALIATGAFEQLPFHMQKAKENGLTADEVAEIITHLAFYVGWPKAWSAFNIAKEVYEVA